LSREAVDLLETIGSLPAFFAAFVSYHYHGDWLVEVTNHADGVVWDLTEGTGKVVPKGLYRYRIECNISWENTVLWTGAIEVGETRASSTATAVYSPAEAEKLGTPVKDAAAVYDPGKR